MNVHEDLIMEYAKDWAETNAPWERWELSKESWGWGWVALREHPVWIPDVKYRRKQRTININGFEVPEPVREPLDNDRCYYIPVISDPKNPSERLHWHDDMYDRAVLSNGLIHLTREAAETHASALLSFTEKKE